MRNIPRTILFVVFDRCQILDFSGPIQAFTSANNFIGDSSRAFAGYETKLISSSGGAVTTESGIVVQTSSLPNKLPRRTSIFLAGGPGSQDLFNNKKLSRWFQSASKKCERYGSVCTGSLALAAWGMLDGKRATTHWDALDDLAQYREVVIDKEPLFVRDGIVWTSAGISAGIDMALAIVEEDAGSLVASNVARRLVLYARRSGRHSQFSDLLAMNERDIHGQFGKLHEWIQENLRRQIRVSEMAEFCCMSERTFLRRYKSATGMAPTQGLLKIRLDAARTLVVTTKLPISAVARRSGFSSQEQLAKRMKNVLGVSPRQLRESN